MEPGGGMRRYTLREARLILSHVYCVHHLPDSDGLVYQWAVGVGEALCSRCSCRNSSDLRLYVASEREASAWLEVENAAIDAYDGEVRFRRMTMDDGARFVADKASELTGEDNHAA